MELDSGDADKLFKLIDAEDSGTINVDNLIKGVGRLKGTARSIDVVSLMLDVDTIRKAVKGLEQNMEQNMNRRQSVSRNAASEKEKVIWTTPAADSPRSFWTC